MSESTHMGWINARDYGASGSGESVPCRVFGTNEILLDAPGDFEVGQDIMVAGACSVYGDVTVLGPHGRPYARAEYTGQVEFEGYDGRDGSWIVYAVDVPKGQREVFRWSDNLGREWHQDVPFALDSWIELSGGTRVRFHEFEWEKGYTVMVSGRDQLRTRVVAVEGDRLTLADAATKIGQGHVTHDEQPALQRAVDAAMAEGKNLFIPAGHYRISAAITLRFPMGITIEGSAASTTLLDISEGSGECIRMVGGEEAAVRNLSMLGHTGFAEKDMAGYLNTKGATEVWGFFYKYSSAVGIWGTERVTVENCHARRMSGEAFFSSGRGRRFQTDKETKYTKRLTFLNCSVKDSARNAFNNSDRAENTLVQNCRVEDVGGCAWEGSSRFVKIKGCYIRNGGGFGVGNLMSRREGDEQFPSGQHVIADNVFESGIGYGDCQISVSTGAVQVIIRGNQFINFNENAIQICGDTPPNGLPAENCIVTGNSIDMTCVEGVSKPRYGIMVTASDVNVGDNQISVRGADENVTGIIVRDDAMRVSVHDNTVRGCGVGLKTAYCMAHVETQMDEAGMEFVRVQSLFGGKPPLLRRRSHGYRGWRVVWLHEVTGEVVGENKIVRFDPESCHFYLEHPERLFLFRPFRLYPPAGAHWSFHDNILQARVPLDAHTYSAESAKMRNNIEIPL